MAADLCLKLLGYTMWIGLLIEASTNNRTNSSSDERARKVLSIFQIVQFKNGPCNTTETQSGTCYTRTECDARGGSSFGTCAGGFGVCCLFSLNCGGMSSENCTYLTQTPVANVINSCKYTICPCDQHICRLRFDFLSFNINGPVTASAVGDTTMTALTSLGGAIGDCTTDSFSITSSGNFAPPIICGFNTGQHMIVDTSTEKCNDATFDLNGNGQRQWNIKGNCLK